MDPLTALLIAVTAAILGPLLGAALNIVGGIVNDQVAHRREQRQQDREYRRLVEQQDREERQRLHEARIQACHDFLDATAIFEPLEEAEKVPHLLRLNKSYSEAIFYASDNVYQAAGALYGAASASIKSKATNFSFHAGGLEKARRQFLHFARYDLEQGFSEAEVIESTGEPESGAQRPWWRRVFGG